MSRFLDISTHLARFAPTFVAVCVAIAVQTLGLAEPVDRRIQDLYVRLGPAEAPTLPSGFPDTAVVAIDPRSLRADQGWPWPRSRHAEVIENLTRAGAVAIAFDIDFSSPSTSKEDARLAEAIRSNGRVVLATFSQAQQVSHGAQLEIVNRPIPLLESAAARLGSVLVPIDPDGVVRHAPRASAIAGVPIPSLARSALEVAVHDRIPAGLPSEPPTGSATRLDYRRHWPEIPRIPYVDVLEGRFEPSDVAGRTIFVGATAAEFQDLWSTPVAPALPGVFIQAIAYRTAAAEWAGESTLSTSPDNRVVAGFLILGLLLMPLGRLNRGFRLSAYFSASAAVLGIGWLSIAYAGVMIPTACALGLIAVQYTLGIEALQRRIAMRAAAQESSLVALARLGDATQASARVNAEQSPITLALELLGEVVGARGIVLLRADLDEEWTGEQLEWRPPGSNAESLTFDAERATQALLESRTIEARPSSELPLPIIYAPLIAGQEKVGVLVVLCAPDRAIEGLHRRTIATVGAQVALTAQNLQLIDRLRETFESSIAAVASAVEARDGYTDQHCRRLAAFSSLMGTRLGMPEDEIRSMELGALLHDVGKIGIPDAVLNKPGRLSNEERKVMQRHPEIGAGIVEPVAGLDLTTRHCIVHHHERWDGTGYPAGLVGDEIPLAARIVAIVDVWDALSTNRPYKKAFAQDEVRELLQKGRGTQFDPDLVELFFEVLEEQGEEMLELIARSTGALDVPC